MMVICLWTSAGGDARATAVWRPALHSGLEAGATLRSGDRRYIRSSQANASRLRQGYATAGGFSDATTLTVRFLSRLLQERLKAAVSALRTERQESRTRLLGEML